MHKRVHLLILVALAGGSSSCQPWFLKKKVDLPAVAPAPLPPPNPVPAETVLPPPPRIAETPNPTPPNIPPEKIVTPPGPKKTPRPPRRKPTPKKQEASPTAEPVTPPPAAPKLGQIFTPEQRAEYVRALDESLERVRRVLASAQNRTLTEAQAGLLQRIRAFERRALQTREQDLVGAVSLANRADVLARDLMAQFQ